jgi:hypothetical protein
MIPVRIYNANVTYVSPNNWDEKKNGKCNDLHVRFNPLERTFQSAWEPTPAQLDLIKKGGKIVLTVWGSQPPVGLHVERETEDEVQVAK